MPPPGDVALPKAEAEAGLRHRAAPRFTLALLLLVAGCGYEGGRPDGTSSAGTLAGDASAAGTLAGGPVQASDPGEPGQAAGAALRAALDGDHSPDRTLGYDAARDALYAYEARTTGGQLCEVYGGACAPLAGGDPSTAAGAIGVNAEHTWPQSFGADDEPLRSDLHHLFPAWEIANSSRGNLPLADVPDASAEAWYRGGQSASRLPRGEAPGAWSQRGLGRFEPRDAHKGNAARALFYVAAVYPHVLDADGAAFFETMRPSLLRWHRQDPADSAERARDAWIARLQGTTNPFVADASLAERAFGAPVTDGVPRAALPSAPGGSPPPPLGEAALWLSALHYDNAGDDANEGVEVAGPPGASLDGWTLALVNGSDGRVYRTLSLAGALSQGGRRWISVRDLQNGSPDGLALVAPSGAVTEFWSYEGPLTATDGAAAGVRAREMPVAQSGRDAAGTALVRAGETALWRLGRHPLGG